MPYRDPKTRAAYAREYRERNSSGRGPGRPPLEDRKIHVSLRLKNSLVGRLSRLLLEGVATGRYPWKTQSHQFEDLLIRGLETLKDSESVDEALQYLRAVSHSEAISRHRREAQAAWSVIDIELKELRTIGATEQAVHQFWATYRAFEGMSPHTWRDWFLQQMRETHKDLYAMQPGEMSLDAEDETDHPTRATKPSKVVTMKRKKR